MRAKQNNPRSLANCIVLGEEENPPTQLCRFHYLGPDEVGDVHAQCTSPQVNV
jgi:hypothetical protein